MSRVDLFILMVTPTQGQYLLFKDCSSPNPSHRVSLCTRMSSFPVRLKQQIQATINRFLWTILGYGDLTLSQIPDKKLTWHDATIRWFISEFSQRSLLTNLRRLVTVTWMTSVRLQQMSSHWQRRCKIKIKESKWHWIGHTLRCNPDHIIRQVLTRGGKSLENRGWLGEVLWSAAKQISKKQVSMTHSRPNPLLLGGIKHEIIILLNT